MPLTYEIDRSKDLTIFTADGDITYEEYTNASESYYEAGPTRSELYDFLNGTWKDLTFKKMSQLLEKRKTHTSRPSWKMAIVIHSDSGFSLAKIYEGLTEIEKTPHEAKIFRSLEDAYQWLNIPQEESGK